MNKIYSIAATSALLSALAVAAGAMAQTKDSDSAGKEKCFGVSLAGKNDCAGGSHSCAGQSTKNGDKSAYLSLPVGLCARLQGGSTTPGK